MNTNKNSKRINDLRMIQTRLEQSYQDYAEYPDYKNFNERVSNYINSIPKDPLEGQVINGCEFGYKYTVGKDDNGIYNQVYKLSTCFENYNNIKNKAEKDGGINDKRFEVGTNGNRNLGKGKFIRDLIK